MDYNPSLPEDNHNITHTHPLKEFIILLVGVLGIFVLAYFVLGLLVDNAVNHISPEIEAKLFNHTAFSWTTIGTDDTDPRLQKLQQLTDSLRKCADIDAQITVHIADFDEINAVAMPGGHIVVFDGLLDKIKTENGISFILAHELGHFKNRDHLRGLGRGIVLTAMAAALTGPDSGLTRLVTPTFQLGQAQYSQGRESLADKTGLHSLHCYYGHVGGATEFFKNILKEPKDGIPLSHYFASHPQMIQRIADIKEMAEAENWGSNSSVPLTF